MIQLVITYFFSRFCLVLEYPESLSLRYPFRVVLLPICPLALTSAILYLERLLALKLDLNFNGQATSFTLASKGCLSGFVFGLVASIAHSFS